MSTTTTVPTTGPSSNGAAAPHEGPERVGERWSGSRVLTRLWGKGMSRPWVARAWWRGAYGTDHRLFVYEWERLADEPAGTRILDVPSGGGVCLLGIAPKTPVHLTACDISEGMLARVRERADARGLAQVDTVQADACALPFDDGSFDLVVTYSGLHCFNKPWEALAEMRRVLVPGGRIRGSVLVRRPGVVAPRVLTYFQKRDILGTVGTWADMQCWCAAAELTIERTAMSGAVAFFEGTRDGDRA